MTQSLLEADLDEPVDPAATAQRVPSPSWSQHMEVEPGPTGAEPAPRWLEEQEMEAWLGLVDVVYRLPQVLDRQLRDEAGISHLYYQMLAQLSAAPERTLTMGELARATGTSPSRLTHAVGTLEDRGWVTRRPCPTNRRRQFATLTDDGFAVLERVAPTHVTEVRRRVFDHLTGDQVEQLRSLATVLSAALDDEHPARTGDDAR